jgi:hypothetical protein
VTVSVRVLQVFLDESGAQVEIELHQRRITDTAEAVDLAGFDHQDIAGARFELLP